MGLAFGRLGLHHRFRYLGKLKTGSDPPKGGPLVEAPLMLRQACPDSSEAEDALISGCLKKGRRQYLFASYLAERVEV